MNKSTCALNITQPAAYVFQTNHLIERHSAEMHAFRVTTCLQLCSFMWKKNEDAPTDINKLAQLQLNQAWGVGRNWHGKITITAKCHRSLKHSRDTEKFGNAAQESPSPTEFQTRAFHSCQSLSG